MKRLLVFAFALTAACVKPPVPAPDAGAAVASADAGTSRYTLDAEKLERFKAYRSRLRAEYAKASEEHRKKVQELEASDAGLPMLLGLEAAERRTKARATCAAQTGLSASEALRIEAMVFNVMAQRSVAKNGEYAKLLAQVKAGLDNMHPDQKVDALQDMKELEAMLRKMENAEALRETLGSANVDLILAHADTLMPIYEQALLDERTP